MATLYAGLLTTLAIVSTASLFASIARLVRTLRSAQEAEVELRQQMEVALPSAGPKTIYVKGPRFTNIRGLSLTLRDAHGAQLSVQRILVPMTVSGVREVSFSFAHCHVPAAGVYTLSASGIPETTTPLTLRFSKPNRLQSVTWILAILLCSIVTIGSIVLAVLIGKGVL